MAEEAEAFYVANYIQCFSMEDVAAALAQIPQVRLVVGVWLRGWAACISCLRGGLAPQQRQVMEGSTGGITLMASLEEAGAWARALLEEAALAPSAWR